VIQHGCDASLVVIQNHLLLCDLKKKLVSNASIVAEKKLFTNALKNFGVYKCHAQNKFGSTNYSIELK